MKVYTKTGDKGTTALVGGTRVPKNHIRIEAYGTADELISYLGFLRDNDISKEDKDFIYKIQEGLMTAASILAAENLTVIDKLPKLSEKLVVEIEKEIDRLEEGLTPLKSFLIPGGHPTVSICHIARTVCRRAERCIYNLIESEEIPELILIFFNRLSDYLFVLSRSLSKYYKAEEIIWKPVLDK